MGWAVGPGDRPADQPWAFSMNDDGVADGLEVLHLVVGDGHAELLLGGHDDLDHGQRVDVEVVDERLVELDVLDGDARDLVDDLGEVGADLFGGGHAGGSSLCCHHGWCGVVRRAGWCGHGTVMTWAAYARPAPNAISSAVSPLLGLALLDHPIEGQGDRGRRGVALLGDVAGDLRPARGASWRGPWRR